MCVGFLMSSHEKLHTQHSMKGNNNTQPIPTYECKTSGPYYGIHMHTCAHTHTHTHTCTHTHTHTHSHLLSHLPANVPDGTALSHPGRREFVHHRQSRQQDRPYTNRGGSLNHSGVHVLCKTSLGLQPPPKWPQCLHTLPSAQTNSRDGLQTTLHGGHLNHYLTRWRKESISISGPSARVVVAMEGLG